MIFNDSRKRLSPRPGIATATRLLRGSDHDAVMPMRRQLTLDVIAARPRLVTEPKPDARAAEFAHQAIQARRRIGDPTIVANLAADAPSAIATTIPSL